MKASHNGWVIEGTPQEILAVIDSPAVNAVAKKKFLGGVTHSAVVRRRKGEKRRWTAAEVRAVKEGLRQGVSVKKIAKSLGRTYWSVTRAVQRINNGLQSVQRSSRQVEGAPATRRSRQGKTWKAWTSQDEFYLRSNWFGGRNVPALVQHTGRTALAIRARAYKLGLPNPFHFPAKDGSGSATHIADVGDA